VTRTGPRRPIVAIRLSTEETIHIDEMAASEHVTRSEMIRRLLAEAIAMRKPRETPP